VSRKKKYSQRLINELHQHAFLEDKLMNREIAKKHKLTMNNIEYILYSNNCEIDDCPQCRPKPMTITESLLTFFGG
jgi:hypothetical protein